MFYRLLPGCVLLIAHQHILPVCKKCAFFKWIVKRHAFNAAFSQKGLLLLRSKNQLIPPPLEIHTKSVRVPSNLTDHVHFKHTNKQQEIFENSAFSLNKCDLGRGKLSPIDGRGGRRKTNERRPRVEMECEAGVRKCRPGIRYLLRCWGWSHLACLLSSRRRGQLSRRRKTLSLSLRFELKFFRYKSESGCYWSGPIYRYHLMPSSIHIQLITTRLL